ncbi:MAG: hypothetical protein GY753_18075, partial [Gammaproteobacteria bacterium]|nr:hypothetical protein [Gammaproteobacteria bacterium]
MNLDAAGQASIEPLDVNDDGGDTEDNCNFTLSVAPSTFTCSDIGANTVTLTSTDGSGNSSSCTATVTVEDNTPPILVCQDITVQLDTSGNASITEDDINGGSTDNCGRANPLSATPDAFTCSDIGPNTVELKVGDGNGNQNTCDATVTVEDNVAPTAVCRDITIQIEASLDVSIMAGDIDDGSTDACGVNGLSLDQNTFDCGDRGDNQVNLTVTDVNGNSSSCEAVVMVEDINMYCAPCVPDSVTVHYGSCEPADTGTMVEVWRNSLDCDSVVTTITSLLESYYVETWETTCDINEESKEEFYYTASNGCDSIVRTFIEWVPPILVNISLLTCDPGEVGVAETVHQGSNGCDSIVAISTILQFPYEVTA